MIKTKIKSSVSAGDPWSNDHGTYYPFTYKFEDGTEGEANHTKNEAFAPGTQVEVTENGTGPQGQRKVKLKKAGSFNRGGGGRQEDKELKMVTMSLAYAKDLICSGEVPQDLIEQAGGILKAQEAVADFNLKWLTTNYQKLKK